MLELFRKNRSSILGYAVLCTVAFLMLGFGLGSYAGQSQSNNVAIRINDHEISSMQYNNRVRKLDQFYRQRLGEYYENNKKSLNIEQGTIDSMIEEHLLNAFIDNLGLYAGTKLIEYQITKDITSIPQLGGVINAQTYRAYLRARGLTGAQLEVETGKQLKVSQLNNTFRDTSLITDAELKTIHNQQNTSYKFNYLKLDSSKYEDKVDLSKDKKINEFFEKHKEDYRKPKSVSFEYVEFRPENYKNQVVVNQEDMSLLYKQKRHEYREPTKYHFRQIVAFKDSQEETSELEKAFNQEPQEANEPQISDASNELKKDNLEKALKKLDDGELFEDVAKEFTEDSKGKENGGDLGWLAFNDMAQHLKDSLNNIEEGQYSELVETPDAFYVLFLDERKEGREKTLEEVKDSLEDTIRENESGVYARAAAYDFFDEWKKATGKSLEETAKTSKLAYAKLKDPISEEDLPTGLPRDIVSKTIHLPKDHKEVIELDDLTYVVKITETHDSYLPELKDVKEEVISAYKKEAAVILARAEANKISNSLNNKTENSSNELAKADTEEKEEVTLLSKTAKDFELDIQETSIVTRSAAFQEPFNVANLKDAAFTLTPNNPISSAYFEQNGAFYFVELTDLTAPDEKSFEEAKKDMAKSEVEKSGSRLQATLVAHLRANADIWVDPKLTRNALN